MAQQRNIRVRISHQRVEALLELCSNICNTFKPTNEHHFLLKEYMVELQHKLKKMIARIQDMYTLSLSHTEAIAFYQLWHIMDLQHDKYAGIVIGTLLKKISAIAA